MVSSDHTMARTFSILLMICHLILSCGKQEVSEKEVISETTPPNILFVIADDMGKDATPNYSEGLEKPQMPTLEMLANSGITFDNVWAFLLGGFLLFRISGPLFFCCVFSFFLRGAGFGRNSGMFVFVHFVDVVRAIVSSLLFRSIVHFEAA